MISMLHQRSHAYALCGCTPPQQWVPRSHLIARGSLSVCCAPSQALHANLKRIMDVFRDWDDDGSGTIDAKEFRRAMRTLGFDERNIIYNRHTLNNAADAQVTRPLRLSTLCSSWGYDTTR